MTASIGGPAQTAVCMRICFFIVCLFVFIYLFFKHVCVYACEGWSERDCVILLARLLHIARRAVLSAHVHMQGSHRARFCRVGPFRCCAAALGCCLLRLYVRSAFSFSLSLSLSLTLSLTHFFAVSHSYFLLDLIASVVALLLLPSQCDRCSKGTQAVARCL